MTIIFVSLREFLPQVQHAVHKCPIISMINALREAAIEFCKETKVWKQSDILIATVAGTAAYEIVPPEKTDVSSIVMVKHDGQKLNPLSADMMDRQASASGTPRYFTFEEPLTLNFAPTPDTSAVDIISVKVALQPVYNATEVPAFLLARYKGAIVAKAKSILMMIPDKAWTDYQLAAANNAQFKQEMYAIKISVEKGGTTKSLRVKHRKFI